jgi:hypothetical protein
VLLGWLLLAALWTTPASVALGEPIVSLESASDGTLTLVGRGWRSGQSLVVSIGQDVFPALADSVGDFEIQTGLSDSGGPLGPLTIRHPERETLAFGRLGPPGEPDLPHPFAVLFAQSLAMGAGLCALTGAGLGLAFMTTRPLRSRRNRHH